MAVAVEVIDSIIKYYLQLHIFTLIYCLFCFLLLYVTTFLVNKVDHMATQHMHVSRHCAIIVPWFGLITVAYATSIQ